MTDTRPLESPENYRKHLFSVSGKIIYCGAMARPNHGKNPLEESVYAFLKKQAGSTVMIGLHELSFQAHANSIGLTYHYIPIEDFAKNPISAAKYDAIYNIVLDAQIARKEVTFHCGAGDGRSGTALASLKLREIIEQEACKNHNILYEYNSPTASVYLPYVKKMVPCTPFVKMAVEKLREERVTMQAQDAGLHSVETQNDIETLIQYELHIKKQLVAQNDFIIVFTGQLELIKNKAVKLEVKGYPNAALSARNLHDRLTAQKNNFSSYKISAKEFVKNCDELVENAKKTELNHPRGLAKFLPGLVNLINKFFLRETSSMYKLIHLQKNLSLFSHSSNLASYVSSEPSVSLSQN